MTDLSIRTLAGALSLALACGVAVAQSGASSLKPGDHIAAVVNQDVVAASEVNQRYERLRAEARQRGETADPEALRKQALEALIEDRVIVTHARENGNRVDEPELDRVVANVATQNRLSMEQLRARLKEEGIDYKRFRENLRDQMMTERVREREVQGRIRVTDGEIDQFLAEQRKQRAGGLQLNLAQILVTVPEGAAESVVAERRAKAEAALQRVKAGEDFAAVAREVSEDGNKARGGEIGLRQADRLPDAFVDFVRDLKSGELAPQLLRSGAGFHVLKLVQRRDGSEGGNLVTQTRARHVLLRPSPQLPAELAARRLQEFKRAIEAGRVSFEAVARDNSEDGSAPQGGDLGWVVPGAFVPEFEEAMNALPVGGLSDPVVSRFGLHLIKVEERREVEVDPKQLREQARNALREQKYEDAYKEWVRDLRARAFVELREWQ
ncbi:MAG: peptidylprolyl isomerase [Roseateles asaccharophilus]|uniref:Chaperone SurA n=1 Tax=Roseateles asaccharophilus TaxID=582607 RepID=A0A4V6PU92_9BURK|nr:peptidylprolyl isomerase [Roseateles asaccharophilus]MDN3543235.1 peptidylprolyl isomerase [Roseateles asaccharophilus]TDP13067.1 periplasmic chaperone for outer membrane proteins SurA [Roseateles asaccharophilus]